MDRAHLEATLRRIDGRGYKAYADIKGRYEFPDFTLFIDHVQSDPFAPPSRLRARTPQRQAAFPSDLFSTPVRRVALEDYVTRVFAVAIRRVSRSRGTGRSGVVIVDAGKQEVLERTSCVVTPEYAEVRFSLGMPAAGRRVLGRECQELLCEDVPRALQAALFFSRYQPERVRRFIQVVEDQEHLRGQLQGRGLVAFVANGSVLPRESGVSDRPMKAEGVIAFQSPPELEVALTCPNRGEVRGMGVLQGVTVIVGGGYHGKSTLLRAVQRGVYDHVPGDGREYVVTVGDAVKVRAEDGRRAEGVDISPFISNLPFQQDTTAFSTENASGSTSQAVNIMEALEAGTSLLLMDEDTCATNFMVRDSRMQRLVPKAAEPITPLVDRVRQLYDRLGVSSILVMGGASDYLETADTVISMDHFLPHDLTARARELVQEYPSHRLPETPGDMGAPVRRVPVSESLSPYRKGRVRVASRGLKTVQFGEERIDLSALEQLVDESQTAAIGDLLVYCLGQGYFDGRWPLREVLTQACADLEARGLDIISPFAGQHPGDYAMPRLQEVAGALNRLRSLKVRQLR